MKEFNVGELENQREYKITEADIMVDYSKFELLHEHKNWHVEISVKDGNSSKKIEYYPGSIAPPINF